MSVTDSNVVDAIGIDQIAGYVILTVSDQLDWRDEESHLIPFVFADSRKFAEEWTYRFLAAAVSDQVDEVLATEPKKP